MQVFIRGSEHIPPEPAKIPNLMNYFVYNYNHDTDDIFSKVAKYHIDFERIHPFEDGNGKTGRLLINYELIKTGRLLINYELIKNNLAPAVIEKDDKVKYFEFLRNVDYTGLAQWIRDLSTNENDRMKKFGYEE